MRRLPADRPLLPGLHISQLHPPILISELAAPQLIAACYKTHQTRTLRNRCPRARNWEHILRAGRVPVAVRARQPDNGCPVLLGGFLETVETRGTNVHAICRRKSGSSWKLIETLYCWRRTPTNRMGSGCLPSASRREWPACHNPMMWRGCASSRWKKQAGPALPGACLQDGARVNRRRMRVARDGGRLHADPRMEKGGACPR